MEENQVNDHDAVNEAYSYTASLMAQGKNSYEITQALAAKGIDGESAAVIIAELENEFDKARKQQANKDMLYGALWCVGGTVLTLAKIGFIFWGAIIFGGIQFIRGLMASVKN